MFFFFFQAEDGIRDYKVTGVQTCALPISSRIDVACFVAVDAGWQTMGNSSEDAPRDRAGSDHPEKCDEQRGGASVSGIREEQGGPGDSGKVWFRIHWPRSCECFPLTNMDALFLSFRLAVCVSAIL